MIPAGWSIFSGCRRESARFACGGSSRPMSGKTSGPAPVADIGFPYDSTAFPPCLLGSDPVSGQGAGGRVMAYLHHVTVRLSPVGSMSPVKAFQFALSCGQRMGMAGCASSGARLCGEYQCRKSLKSSASLLLLALSPLAAKLLLNALQPAQSSARPLLWSLARTSPTAASSAARLALFRARSCRPHRTATNICQDIAQGLSPAH